jgi:hypothetical protein
MLSSHVNLVGHLSHLLIYLELFGLNLICEMHMKMQCHDMLQNMVILACLGLLSCSKTLDLQLQSFHLLKIIKKAKENVKQHCLMYQKFCE